MTDWTLIRKLVNTAIDTCEHIEQLGVSEEHRGLAVNNGATIHEFLISSWVAPENLTRKVICKSHELGVAKPYTDELARTLSAIGNLCSELVKLEKTECRIEQTNKEPTSSIKSEVEALCKWYEELCVPTIECVMKAENQPNI